MIILANPQIQDLESANLPGSGLINDVDRDNWRKFLNLLPESIANDPNSSFCNPKLFPLLNEFVLQQCLELGTPRLNEAQYLELLNRDISPKKVANYLTSLGDQLAQSDKNAYHNGYHSKIEVPQRLQILQKNLSQNELVHGTLALNYSKAIMALSAPTHDLGHVGVGYAQRITPGLNISNEERSVVLMTDPALAAGLNPIQVFEMQRVILPTSFFQKPTQLGLDKDPNAQFEYLSFDLTKPKSFPKAQIAREYDPDASALVATRKMAQLLALADVCVTLGSFEQWIERSSNYYLEVRAAKGCVPTSFEEFVKNEMQFLNAHVMLRLNACKDFLKPEFIKSQTEAIKVFSQRLQSVLEKSDNADFKLMSSAYNKICNSILNSTPRLEGLLEF